MYTTQKELLEDLHPLSPEKIGTIPPQNTERIRTSLIDKLITTAVFSPDEFLKQKARTVIRQLAHSLHIIPASHHELYRAIGQQKISGFTVPALNVRTLTYDTARLVFALIKKNHIGAVIFEIARSEIAYTMQRPDEYAVSILAGAIKEGYVGPVFLQADHFQFSKNKYNADSKQELATIQALTKEAITADFFNIDIDASTLVDLQQENLIQQQKINAQVTSEMTQFIRRLQPQQVMISIGGEIGHIGGKNSTVADFEAFMHGYAMHTPQNGISKVSVQTGTSHGGIPLANGEIAKIKLDFSVLESIGKIARVKYHIGGAVQHGASTLPKDLFHKFVTSKTLEIHLATGFQNIVFDTMPKQLKNDMEAWIRTHLKDEWEENLSEEQFLYKSRKKSLGPFKQRLWELPISEKQVILDALSQQLAFLFEQLHMHNTKEKIQPYVS